MKIKRLWKEGRMMLKKIYHKIIPIGMRCNISCFRNKRLYKKNLAYLHGLWNNGKCDMEFKSELEYIIKNNAIKCFPYQWGEEYCDKDVPIFKDNSGLYYVIHNNKKLFFPKGYSKKYIRKYYISLLMEQDARSPHCYFESGQIDFSNAIFADVGGAEGIISLEMVDKCKGVVIFEADNSWMSALNKTFEPWNEKVQIISKFVSDISGDSTLRLDDYFLDYAGEIVLKMDVEGNELKCLRGARNILSEGKVSALYVCTYHRDEHGIQIYNELNKYEFRKTFSSGYMFYGMDTGIGSFRKGLLRAYKES